LQELPEIPNYANPDMTLLVDGLTLAIEPMISLGSFNIQILPDNWSVQTLDHSPTAHFETTVVINNADPEILVDFPLTYPVDQKGRLW
jgi:methionyl aminopeptidase